MTATLDWLGCATFRLILDGPEIDRTVVMLDAYIDRVPEAEGPGITADAITEADWILVGHSHFDHLWGAERIAKRTGARIIGSYESIRIMHEQGVPADQLVAVGGGELIELTPGVRVRPLPSQHSCVWIGDTMGPADTECIGDLDVPWHQQQERLSELIKKLGGGLGPSVASHMKESDQGARGDGGALVFLIETPDGKVLYQDTSGRWDGIMEGIEADAAILAAAGRANIDGQPVQGSLAGFIAEEVEMLGRPRTLVLGHHDDWLPGFSSRVDTTPIRTAVAAVSPETQLLEPGYLEPIDLL